MPPSRHVLRSTSSFIWISTFLVSERFRRKVLAMPLTIDDHDSRIQYEYLESFRGNEPHAGRLRQVPYMAQTQAHSRFGRNAHIPPPRNGLKELGVELPMLPPNIEFFYHHLCTACRLIEEGKVESFQIHPIAL